MNHDAYACAFFSILVALVVSANFVAAQTPDPVPIRAFVDDEQPGRRALS